MKYLPKLSMNKELTKYLCYISTLGFLVLRYSPLGLVFARLTGIQEAQTTTGVINEIEKIIFILTSFSLLLYFIFFQFNIIEKAISRLIPNDKNKYILLVVVIFLTLFIGVNTYSIYTDEGRDFSVFQSVENYGIDLYINNINSTTSTQILDKSHLEYLNWARRLHPPLHYSFATSVASLFNGIHNIQFYRTLFALLFCIWLIAIIGISSILGASKVFVYSLAIIPFVYTHFRNYTLIRCGIEFFAFMGFTTFMLVIYLIYYKKIKYNLISAFILYISFLVAFWGKFSTIVAAVSMICSLIIVISVSKCLLSNEINLQRNNTFFSRLLVITSLIFVAVAGLYVVTFHNTLMLKEQFNSYVGKLSQFLPFLPTPSDYVEFTGMASRSGFFKSFVFWYSPILLFGLINAIYRIWKHFIFSDRKFYFDSLIISWLLIGLVGVFLVEPRATYTSPLTFGLIYLISRGLELTNNKLFTYQYLSVSILFGCTEVLLTAFSS